MITKSKPNFSHLVKLANGFQTDIDLFCGEWQGKIEKVVIQIKGEHRYCYIVIQRSHSDSDTWLAGGTRN